MEEIKEKRKRLMREMFHHIGAMVYYLSTEKDFEEKFSKFSDFLEKYYCMKGSPEFEDVTKTITNARELCKEQLHKHQDEKYPCSDCQFYNTIDYKCVQKEILEKQLIHKVKKIEKIL